MASSIAQGSYGGAGPFMMGVFWTEALIGTMLVILRAFYARTLAGKVRWDLIYVANGLVGFSRELQSTTVIHQSLYFPDFWTREYYRLFASHYARHRKAHLRRIIPRSLGDAEIHLHLSCPRAY